MKLPGSNRWPELPWFTVLRGCAHTGTHTDIYAHTQCPQTLLPCESDPTGRNRAEAQLKLMGNSQVGRRKRRARITTTIFQKKWTKMLLRKGARVNWIVDWGSLSPPFFPPSFIYLMWNHASLLSLVSASITVSCLHRAVCGVRRSPRSASTADPIWTDQTKLDGTWLAKQVCAFLSVPVCAFVIDDWGQHVYPSVCDCLFLHRTCFQSSVSRRYSAGALP